VCIPYLGISHNRVIITDQFGVSDYITSIACRAMMSGEIMKRKGGSLQKTVLVSPDGVGHNLDLSRTWQEFW
jgi:hypothetical protein